MAALTVRNLPDDVRDQLRVRAAKNGRSMEAEVRAILEAACAEPKKMSLAEVQKWVDELYGNKKPKNVADELIAERREEARREEEEYRRDRARRVGSHRRSVP
ncbi:MAG TPA: Arc family DNA-binding protein [Thermoanaerobaculia bacterium]